MNPIRRTRPIPADGLERALREGRHRRRKAAAFAGAPALSLVVALVLVLQSGGGGQDSLGTLNDPEGTSTATAEPTPSATPSPGESAESSGNAEASPEPSTETSAEPECVDDGCSSEDDSGSYGTAPPHGDPMPTTDWHTRTVSTQCAGTTAVPSGHAFCSYINGPNANLYSGQGGTLGLTVCRATDTGGPNWEWAWGSGQEHDGYVATAPNDPSARIWRWSTGKVFTGSAHTDTMGPQTCFGWSVVWEGRDDAGQPLAPGTYYFGIYSTDLGGEVPPSEMAITVSE